MLIKAILTGGVLSVLAGSIVYFGTDGADALERDVSAEVRVEETELAGAVEPIAEAVVNTPKQTVKEKRQARAEARAAARAEARAKEKAQTEEVEARALAETKTLAEAEASSFETVETVETVVTEEVKDKPPEEKSKTKPKTRWLDQYLKSNKSSKDEAKGDTAAKEEIEVEMETEVEVEMEAAPHKIQKKRVIIKMDGDKKVVWSSNDESFEMPEGFELPEGFEMDEDIDIEMFEGLSFGEMDENIDVDMEMLEGLLNEHSDLNESMEIQPESNADIHIFKMKKEDVSDQHFHEADCIEPIDYAAVLVEAKKLQVTDMRNQAIFEIIDYAIDRGDIGAAADIVQELSSPEFRDTGRAKIGVGLANQGDMKAAFAVLDEIEIDELTAPIRLEIIAALMATRAERKAAATAH